MKIIIEGKAKEGKTTLAAVIAALIEGLGGQVRVSDAQEQASVFRKRIQLAAFRSLLSKLFSAKTVDVQVVCLPRRERGKKK